MALQSLDIIRRSATSTPSPEVRGAYTGTVAKLIDEYLYQVITRNRTF